MNADERMATIATMTAAYVMIFEFIPFLIPLVLVGLSNQVL
jgi:hypothetical protein